MLDKLLMVRSDGTKYLILSSTGKFFSVFNLSTITWKDKEVRIGLLSHEHITIELIFIYELCIDKLFNSILVHNAKNENSC